MVKLLTKVTNALKLRLLAKSNTRSIAHLNDHHLRDIGLQRSGHRIGPY